MTDLMCTGPGPHLEPPGRPDGWVASVPTAVALQLAGTEVLCPACADRVATPAEAQTYEDRLARLDEAATINAELAQQNEAVIGAARDMAGDTTLSAYDPAAPQSAAVASITAPALSRVVLDLVQMVKIVDGRTRSLATGVRIVAEHDQQAIPQRSDLIDLCRYIAGELEPAPVPDPPAPAGPVDVGA